MLSYNIKYLIKYFKISNVLDYCLALYTYCTILKLDICKNVVLKSFKISA